MNTESEWLAALSETFVYEAFPNVVLGVGDDAAILTAIEDRTVFATDVLVEGVHFDFEYCSPVDIAYKSIAVNLSDIAAMGARPEAAVVTIVIRRGLDLSGLLQGFGEASKLYGCPIVGGDTSSGDQLMVNVAVVGSVDNPVTRSGARAGQSLFVTGNCGGSARGLEMLRFDHSSKGKNVSKHLRPTPRLAEGIVARQLGATAMIDVSDGLSTDLHRLCQFSEIGAEIDVLPVEVGCTREQALSGGEDYELLFCLPQAVSPYEAFKNAGLSAPIKIGITTDEVGIVKIEGELHLGNGYEHRW